jgi:peptidoglycan/LPS O-acetylase OafA/YrhL
VGGGNDLPRSEGNAVRQHRRVREDIQGLRAIGALLVASFHIWFTGVSGGIDVFFVLSGYFLAAGQLDRARHNRDRSILEHTESFLLRLVPQALLALAAILLIVIFLTTPTMWIENLRGIVASALYIQNWWLIFTGQDYLAQTASPSLTQHFWAVAVIGQVYFAWPLIGALAGGIAARLAKPLPVVLLPLIAALTAASFAWSVQATAANPEAAYFDTFSRFWQFGVGVLLALGEAWHHLPRRTAAALSWFGLGLILSTGPAIGTTVQFPGLASLWPVAGAALVVLAGRDDDPWNAGRFLAARPLVLLGGVSFGLYLWHWPLYVVVLEAQRGEMPSILMGLAILAASVVAGTLGKRVADATAGRLRVGLPHPLPGLTLAVGLVAVSVAVGLGERMLRWNDVTLEQTLRIDRDLRPGPISVRHDLPDFWEGGCMQGLIEAEVLSCTAGSQGGRHKVVLVGSSTAKQWFPALTRIAESRDWQLVSKVKAACPFADPRDEQLFQRENLHPSCSAWNEAVIEDILGLEPDLVVTVGSRPVFPEDGFRGDAVGEWVPGGFLARFETLADAGIPVVAIRETPRFGHHVPNCVFSPWTAEPEMCGRPANEVLDETAFEGARVEAPTGVVLIDMNDTICDEHGYCHVVRDGLLLYRDTHHLTPVYVEALAPLVEERLEEALRGEVGNSSSTGR